MRKLALAAVVAMIAFLPFGAQAQQKPGDVMGLNSSQVVAIGVGIVGGVIVAEAVMGLPVWAGAVAGGLVGNWWYSQQAEAMKANAATKAAALADEAQLHLISAKNYLADGTADLSSWVIGKALAAQ